MDICFNIFQGFTGIWANERAESKWSDAGDLVDNHQNVDRYDELH